MEIGLVYLVFIAAVIIQGVLCAVSKNIHIRLGAVYLGLAFLLVAALLYAGALGDFSAGMLGNGHVLLAVVMLIGLGVFYAGLLMGFLCYKIIKRLFIKKN